jgi:hypothetical protein
MNKNNNEILKTTVAGVMYGDYSTGKLDNLKYGSPVKLYWEPSNQFDRQAIKVVAQSKGHGKLKLGYIPREHTELLHKYREAGIRLMCYIHSINKNNPSWSLFVISIHALGNLEPDVEI